MRTDLTNAQATVQTLLLTIVSFVVAWLSVNRVSWQVFGDPCVLAAAATLVIVACLWLTRRRGLPGSAFLPTPDQWSWSHTNRLGVSQSLGVSRLRLFRICGSR